MPDAALAAWTSPLPATPGPLTLEWALLLAAAAFAGHLVQRWLGLPKLIGYAVLGALAGLAGYAGTAWPLSGIGLYLLELGIAMVLFEAGARLPLRWLRHNPMVLVQSLAEALLTFAAVLAALRGLGMALPAARALAVVAVASSPAVLMRVAHDLRASGPVTDRATALATLNTLYALTLGTAMLHTIDRGDVPVLASLAGSGAVLGLSALVALALAAALLGALRLMSPTSQDTGIVILALIGAGTAIAAPLGGSAPLAALLAGLMLKQLNPRPWVWPRQLGTAGSVLSMLMFVLVSSMAAQADWGGALGWATLALIGARLAAKVASVALTGPASALSLRQSLWTGLALMPMSAVALLLTSQFVVAAPTIGARVAAIALPAILLSELLGAVLVHTVLVRGGEALPPGRRPESPEAGAPKDDTP